MSKTPRPSLPTTQMNSKIRTPFCSPSPVPNIYTFAYEALRCHSPCISISTYHFAHQAQMGGCASKPKEFDGPRTVAPAEPEVTVKTVEHDDDPQEEVKTETTKEECKEAPLLDLSEPKPEAEAEKSPVVELLASEISTLKADDIPKAEPVVVKEEEPAVEKVAAATEEKEKAVKAEKVEEVKEPAAAVVVDEKKENVSV